MLKKNEDLTEAGSWLWHRPVSVDSQWMIGNWAVHSSAETIVWMLECD